MMEEQILNVTAVNNYISSVFRAEELLHNISVAGEISNMRIAKGHAYFILKDEKSQLNCSCFNCSKTYTPKDGESVIIKGSVDYYSAGGRLSFNADNIKPLGQGMLAFKLAKLKEKLTGEGLFDIRFKKPIPPYPTDVCVITAYNGAVIKDIKRTIRRKNDLIDIYIKDVKVQGKDAHLEIIDALDSVDKMNYDVIIIARGGGSAEDLMTFNEESLVRAIFRCNTPIISAVGHESDVTLCDEVADYRAATPTAAAEKVAYSVDDLKAYINQCGRQMKSSIDSQVQLKQRDLKARTDFIKSQTKLLFVQNARKIKDYAQSLKVAIDNKLHTAEANYDKILARLTADNPLAVMQRGYWYVSKDGAIVSSAKGLNVNDEVSLKTHDGEIKAKITEV